MSVSVLNTTASLSGKTLLKAEDTQTITGLKTFDLGASAPFAIVSGAAKVANLDADKLDGLEGAAYAVLANATAFLSSLSVATTLGVTGATTLLSTLAVTGLATLTAGFAANANSTIIGTGSGGTNLTVQTATTGAPGISLKNTTTGILAQIFGTDALGMYIAVNAGNTFGLEIDATGAWRGRLYGAGTATFSAAGVVSSVSDERLKRDIQDLGYGLAEVLRLRPIRHRYTEDSGLNDPANTEYGGFSAQDVQRAMPLAIGSNAQGYLSISDRTLLAALVNAVKELYGRAH